MKITMRCKIGIVFIVAVVLTVSSLCIHILLAPGLTGKKAFIMVFGNYDVHKNAIWKNMQFSKTNYDDYFSKKTGIVSRVFFQSYKENGKRKFFLLTKTIPIDFPFQCHACRPLLSAAIFSREKGVWQVEAKNIFLKYDGEYGIVPAAKLIQIGDDRFGLMLELQYVISEMTDTEVELLVPYKKNIVNAYQGITYFDNFNNCGRSIQCATYSEKIDFDKSKKADFYALKTTRFGTDTDSDQNDIAVPVDEELVYQFREGKYVQVSRKGIPKMRYDKPIDEENM